MKKLLSYIVNFIIDNNILWPFYYPIIFLMKEVRVNNASQGNGVTILALNPYRFRGDLEDLAQAGFKVLKMPYKWQTRVFYAYKGYNYKDKDLKDHFKNPPANSKIHKDRVRLRGYLSNLLEAIFLKKEINCIIGANIFYNQDFDWAAAAVDIGCPYIVFHRENLVVNKHMHMVTKKYAELLNEIGFCGTSIVFHNNIMKNIYDKYSGVNPSKIHALGSIRMDRYIHILKNNKFKSNNGILLFTFPPSSAIIGKHEDNFGWYELHNEVHTAFVELAIENPKINFIIKNKGVGWEETEALLIKLGALDLDNLIIHGEFYDAQKLILESNVVTGFCSTALLESAIAGKPIIYPFFNEAQNGLYSDYLCFSDALDMFDLATNKSQFKDLLIERFRVSEISKKVMKYRELQFEKHVSSLSSNALQKYSNLIFSEVKRHNINNKNIQTM